MDPTLIIAAINGGIQLVKLAMQAAQDLKQNAELTPEQDAALDAAMEQAFATSPAWQPEAPQGS